MNRFRPGLAAVVTAAAILISTTGCGCSGSDEAPGKKTLASCKPDPALITERRVCRNDDQCPCGAHCSLGECVAACSVNAECGGGRCDRFGRCRAPGDDALAFPIDTAPAGRLELAPPVVGVTGPGDARPIHVLAVGADLGALRAVADEGLEIECEPGRGFGRECRFDSLAVATDRTLDVRIAAGATTTSPRMVRVFSGSDVATVDVDLVASVKTLSITGLEAGVYQGSATLLDSGTSADANAAGSTVGSGGTVGLSARIFQNPDVLVIEDSPESIRPGSAWVGSLTQGLGAVTIHLPSYLIPKAKVTSGAETEVRASAIVSKAKVTDGTLSFEVVVRYTGMFAGARAPQNRWSVGLTRTDALPTGATAPAVPADAALTRDTQATALALTPWEAKVDASYQPWTGRTPGDLANFEATCRRAGGTGWLDACSSAADRTGVTSIARDRGWGVKWVADTLTGQPDPTSTRPLFAALSRAISANDTTASHFSGFTASVGVSSAAGERDVPCEVSFTSTPIPSYVACPQAPTSLTVGLGTIDVCAAMQRDYGCAPYAQAGNLQVSIAFTELQASYVGGSCLAPATAPTNLPGTVVRVCRLPKLPPACAELADCFPDGTPTDATRNGLSLAYLGSNPKFVSGDLECASGSRSAALDLDVNAELLSSDALRLSADEAMTRCTEDLDQLALAPPSSPGGNAGGVAAVFRASSCIDAPRFLYALGLATDAARRHAIDVQEPEIETSSAIAHRLLARWLQLHAFLAREASQRHELAAIVSTGDPTQDPNLPPIDETLDRSLAGYDLLLHPRFATAIDGLPDAVLANPDYRDWLPVGTVKSEAHHEQGLGLPVVLAEALGAQYSLLEVRLEAAALTGDLTALTEYAKLNRYLALLRPVMLDLHARALAFAAAAGGPPQSWAARFDTATQTLTATIGRVSALAAALHDGRNPLGIEDSDLPLYFLGDEANASSRFSAISDFLIGTGPGGSAWAPAAVTSAQQSAVTARTAWLAQQGRKLMVAQAQSDAATRIDKVRTLYGERINGLCGLPSSLSSMTAVEAWKVATGGDFNPSNCYFREDSPPGCPRRGAIDSVAPSRLTVPQIRYRLCIAAGLRGALGSRAGFSDFALNELADAFDSCTTLTFPVTCSLGPACLRCDRPNDSVLYAVSAGALLGLNDAHVPPQLLASVESSCRARMDVDTTLPAPEPADATCYRGALGELALSVQAVAQDVKVARSEFADLYDAYDIAMNSCFTLHVGNDRLKAAQAAHGDVMSKWRKGKLAADIVANMAGSVKDCSQAQNQFFSAGVNCGAAVVEGAAKSVSAGLQFAMDEAEQAHDLEMASIQAGTDEARCYIEAKQNLVGARTATLRIERAVQDLAIVSYQFWRAKGDASDAYNEGVQQIAIASQRTVVPLEHDLWVSPAVSDARRKMRLARRVTYLAVRAAEYESQQSLGLRPRVLQAKNPADLQSVIDELWQATGTRGVGGKRPTDLKVVISLRSQLLQLATYDGLPDGWQQLSDTERFHLLLQWPRYRDHDASGAYLGQRIPFSLAPLGIGGGEAIPVLSGADCAERVWSVNASILGTAPYVGDAPSFARIDLLKQNTFYSQWCAAPVGGPTTQLASVRPSRNLFRDPELGTDIATQLGGEISAFTRARIEAYFNVSRADLETAAYENGQTSELAARGLYGEYALFIPASVISSNGSVGLDLGKVDDILLRLDYVSIAK